MLILVCFKFNVFCLFLFKRNVDQSVNYMVLVFIKIIQIHFFLYMKMQIIPVSIFLLVFKIEQAFP